MQSEVTSTSRTAGSAPAETLEAPGEPTAEERRERVLDEREEKLAQDIRSAGLEIIEWFRPIVEEAVSLAWRRGSNNPLWSEEATDREIHEIVLKRVVQSWYSGHDSEPGGWRTFSNRADENVLDLLMIVRPLRSVWEESRKLRCARAFGDVVSYPRGA